MVFDRLQGPTAGWLLRPKVKKSTAGRKGLGNETYSWWTAVATTISVLRCTAVDRWLLDTFFFILEDVRSTAYSVSGSIFQHGNLHSYTRVGMKKKKKKGCICNGKIITLFFILFFFFPLSSGGCSEEKFTSCKDQLH